MSRKKVFWLRFLVIFISLIVYTGVVIYFSDKLHTSGSSRIGAIGFALFGAFIVVSPWAVGFFSAIDENSQTEEEIIQKKIEIKKIYKDNKKLGIFQSVQLNVSQIEGYIRQNRKKATNAFWFCISTITVGFIVIILGIVIFYLKNSNELLTALYGISGIIIEFIAALFLKIYRTIIKQSNYYFEELIKNQDTLIAINISREVRDKSKMDDIIGQIVKSLLNKSKQVPSNKMEAINP